MKQKILMAAAVIGSLVLPATALASTGVPQSASYPLSPKHIQLDGKRLSQPFGFVYQNTTYIEIYTIQQLLISLGLKVTWNGSELKMTLPAYITANLANVIPGSGDRSILINGVVVQRFNGIAERPNTTAPYTEFAPLWYVMRALQYTNAGTFSWQVDTLNVTENSFIDYTNSGAKLGVYTDLQSAESALSNHLGGYVTDEAGNRVYREPIFYAESPTGQVLGTYATQSAAEGALSNSPGGYVKGANGNIVYYAMFSAKKSDGTVVGIYATEAGAQAAISAIPGAAVYNHADQIVYQVPDFSTYTASNVKQNDFLTEQAAIASIQGEVGYYVNNVQGARVYTESASFTNVDLRYSAPSDINASSIQSFLAAYNSPLAGLASTFITAQNLYGVNANYLVSHAVLETGWGKSQIALAKNNLYGYGAYDSNPGIDAGLFPSNEYAILYQAWAMRRNYLDPTGDEYVSPTLAGMNVNYATDTQWGNSIGMLMGELASSAGGSVAQYQQYKPRETAPAPNSTTEPVFYFNGAQATAQAVGNYNGVPYYPTLLAAESQMFSGNVQEGTSGLLVASMQNALNSSAAVSPKLATDGVFGPLTKAGVEQFQQANGLNPSGVVDFATWEKLMGDQPTGVLTQGQAVTIEQFAQGLFGGYVVGWCDLAGLGWVNDSTLALQNVYRLAVQNPISPYDTTVDIYNPSQPSVVLQTMHAGDFVVANTPSANNGYITIQVADANGNPITGLIKTSQARLTVMKAF